MSLSYLLVVIVSAIALIIERKHLVLPLAWAYGFYFVACKYEPRLSRLLFCLAIAVDIVIYATINLALKNE